MATPVPRDRFEGKYLTLKDEHAELKKKCRDQEVSVARNDSGLSISFHRKLQTTIRKMQTKVAMIEENMKR